MGWVEGLGYDLLLHSIQALQVLNRKPDIAVHRPHSDGTFMLCTARTLTALQMMQRQEAFHSAVASCYCTGGHCGRARG